MGSSPADRPGSRHRRITRILTGVLTPVVAAGSYLLIYHTVPGFDEATRDAWRMITNDTSPRVKRPEIFTRTGRRYLWGGEQQGQEFDITTCRLAAEKLNYGLGREHFAALIEPRFIPASEATWLTDAAPILAVRIGRETHVYPVSILKGHEVVNDVVGGRPVFAAYCILARLGALYDRTLGEHTLTFAVSGYTYADPDVWDGRNAFVLWDRETESLWWPPCGRAVSGPLVDAPLPLLDETLWLQTTWGEFRAEHTDALVLDRFQDLEPPASWPRLTGLDRHGLDASTLVAPRWGSNASLEDGRAEPGSR